MSKLYIKLILKIVWEVFRLFFFPIIFFIILIWVLINYTIPTLQAL